MSRDKEIIKLRQTRNKRSGKFYALSEIGNKFKITPERVRQILKNNGITGNPNRAPIITKTCKCGKKFKVVGNAAGRAKKICSRNRSHSKFSSLKERNHYYYLRRIKSGWIKDYYSRKEVKERIRRYNRLPRVKEYQRRWRLKNREI